MNSKPLAGVKVIDLTIYVAAPAGSSVLGYLGADVIKVEPLKGDPYRMTGIGFGIPASEEMNPLYDTCNSYKRAIAMDLRSEEGKAALRRLIEQADMFVTNYREQALVGMGFTYEEVKKINPKIVYGKVDGYGEKGADSSRAGFDATAFFARSGFADEGSYTDGPPMVTPSGAGDTITSMALTIGLLGAYLHSKQTGEGQKVTSSLYTSALWTMASPIARHQCTPRKEDSWGKPGFLAVNGDFRCKDGSWVRFCGMEAERTWDKFCRALGLEEYMDDPRFTTSKEQRDHSVEGFELIQDKVQQKTYEEWDPIFRANDLPYEKVQTPVEAVRDPQAIANGYVETLSYGDQTVYFPNPPFQLSELERMPKNKAPKLGEHSVEILRDFGFEASEIDALLTQQKLMQA